jgi:hypothetical protein
MCSVTRQPCCGLYHSLVRYIHVCECWRQDETLLDGTSTATTDDDESGEHEKGAQQQRAGKESLEPGS